MNPLVSNHMEQLRQRSTLDGIARSQDREHALNAVFRQIFSGPEGKTALEYLRRITIESRLGPDASAEQLRHMEGMRSLAAIIEARANSDPQDGSKSR